MTARAISTVNTIVPPISIPYIGNIYLCKHCFPFSRPILHIKKLLVPHSESALHFLFTNFFISSSTVSDLDKSVDAVVVTGLSA